MNGLALVTQMMFVVTMLGMGGASIYFFLERDSLTAEFRSTSTIAGIYTGIACVMYYKMTQMVGTDGQVASVVAFPTEFRYVDWIVTTPLMLVKFVSLLQVSEDKKGLVWIMVAADLMMIVVGYFGEHLINTGGMPTTAWMLFGVSCLAWFFLLFMIFSTLTEASRDKLVPIKAAFARMRLFITFGWAIYPLGFVVVLLIGGDESKVIRELVYNIADLINKVGFGLVAVTAARQIARNTTLREAIRSL